MLHRRRWNIIRRALKQAREMPCTFETWRCVDARGERKEKKKMKEEDERRHRWKEEKDEN